MVPCPFDDAVEIGIDLGHGVDLVLVGDVGEGGDFVEEVLEPCSLCGDEDTAIVDGEDGTAKTLDLGGAGPERGGPVALDRLVDDDERGLVAVVLDLDGGANLRELELQRDDIGQVVDIEGLVLANQSLFWCGRWHRRRSWHRRPMSEW